MRSDQVPGARRTGVLALVVGLLVAGCTGDPAPTVPSPTVSPTPTPVATLTFEQAAAALVPDLVPTAEVQPCEEYEAGSPEAQEYLDRLSAEMGAASDEEAAAAVTAPTPTLPSCGFAGLESVRAASITGFAHGPADPVVLPVAGGAARIVEVYELADAQAAATTYAARVADEEGWAADQEIPAEELEGGHYQPRRVVSGARLEAVDLPGWTATTMSRDEASFTRDGAPASDPVSYGYLWAVRDAIVVRVQVAGDAPGAAAATALDTARALTAGIEGASAGG
ncbi:hypothetical protein [Cellulomonas sp. S1-8]|uniref:hypothetical protein n=1 Tax=Cellulomonas sp. S1-8 TaxID=2904790 RepID=UPI002243E320|nr:hypothetical protein [Cellulomonas sp. S1-8]UZN03964.1 hypothetical protein OKX07_03210 [Cellulomonas sp. S1-8]